MRKVARAGLVILLLTLSACGKGGVEEEPRSVAKALELTLEAGTAKVTGTTAFQADGQPARTLLEMSGFVDFQETAQSLEFIDAQAAPEEEAQIERLLTVDSEYFIQTESAVAGYPKGTEWVLFQMEDLGPPDRQPDLQALIEPLVAIHLLGGAESEESVQDESDGVERLRVVVNFQKAAELAPVGLRNRIAPFAEVMYDKELGEGALALNVSLDEGLVSSIEIPVPFGPPGGDSNAQQIYRVVFDDFGVQVTVERPSPEVTAELDQSLYIEGMVPPMLRSEELEKARSTCRSELEVYGSLQAMAQTWGVEDAPSESEELVEVIAAHFTEQFMGSTFEAPEDLKAVHAQGCRQGLNEGLKAVDRNDRRRAQTS